MSMQTVMDNLTEDVNEELDMSNDSEALLQSNQSIDNVSLDGNTASTDKTKGRSTVSSDKVCYCFKNCQSLCKLILTRMSGRRLKQEVVAQLKLAVPVVLTLFFQYSLLFVSLIFVGHIPDEDDNSLNYAAAGLGASFVNVTGLSVGQGLATAVDTLCSQAYGYKNYERVGIILQRGILIVGLVLFPIWALWLNSESLLLLVQQEPCVARLSSFYIQVQTVSLPFIFLYILLQHYLNAQSVVWQFVVVGLLTNCISVILHCILIYGVGLGYRGAVIALVLSNIAPPFMVIVYVWVRKVHKLTWKGFSWHNLDEWIPFLKLAIPGMLMTCLEWWGAEVITFISGGISKTELAATSVWFQIMFILYLVPIGISIATSIRVGNALGGGDPAAAKRTSFVAMGMAFFFAVICSILLLITKDYIGALFISGDEDVVKRVSSLMYVAAVMILMDFVEVVLTGSLKGSGRQYIGATLVFIAYYIIGLPLGIVLALKLDLGALGLWTGMTCGNFVRTVLLLIIVLRSNWKKLSEKAMQQAQDKPDHTVGDIQESTKKDTEEILTESDTKDVFSSMTTDNELVLESFDPLQEINNQPKRGLCRSRIKNLIFKGSFFVVGLAILVAGGVSSQFHPYVDTLAYSNCTNDFELMNRSNSS